MVTKDKPRFYNATEVAERLDIGMTSAYAIIKKLNKELEAQGKIVVHGKIIRRYFDEKTYL